MYVRDIVKFKKTPEIRTPTLFEFHFIIVVFLPALFPWGFDRTSFFVSCYEFSVLINFPLEKIKRPIIELGFRREANLLEVTWVHCFSYLSRYRFSIDVEVITYRRHSNVKMSTKSIERIAFVLAANRSNRIQFYNKNATTLWSIR